MLPNKNEIPLKLIFDNAGGFILNIDGGKYACRTMNATEAACLVVTYLSDRSVDGWEGHEPKHAINPTPEQIASGCYRVAHECDINAMCERDEHGDFKLSNDAARALIESFGWLNVAEFVKAIREYC